LGWYVPDPVGYPFSEPGKNRFYEYVAYHDVMGEWKSGHFHNNAPHKVDMGWIPDSSIQTVTTSGTYTIAPLETSTSAIQIIKIPKADTGQYYLLEYRQPIGFDAQLPGATVSGIGINVSGLDASIIDPAIDWFITGAKLVDNTPGDYTFNNQTLTDGNTFDDIANGIEITQLSHNASGAVVQINFVSTSCVKDNPTVTISPLSQSGDVGETLTYTVEVKNNNSPACGANTFGLSSFLPPGFSAIFTPASLNLASDSISIVQMEVTSDVGLTDSNNTFSAIATNSVDPTYFGSGSASYVVFTDVTKPVVTIIKPDKRTKVKFNSIPVQATATDDVTVVKMELYINNVLTSQTNTNSLNYVWATQNIAKGKYTVLFKAYDTAGNVGQSSVEIIKDSGAHR
jgi:uncharacterized repeat protein (TIGR01451 family)